MMDFILSRFLFVHDLDRRTRISRESSFVTGYDFSRAAKVPKTMRALAPSGPHRRLFISFVLLALTSICSAQTAPSPTAQSPAKNTPIIRFEDATAKAGIDFTHSFGSRQLGSLLEGTGAGCVWFDYDNDGKPDLYVVNGRPLDDSMHPYPLKEKPVPPPHNHLYRNDGNGRFTDVTDKAGLNPDMYSIAVTAADYDNDGFIDLLVTGFGRTILYHNDGNGHFTDVTVKAGINVERWAISSTWLDYDKDGCVDLFVGRYVKFDPTYRNYYAADNYPGPLDYEGETNKLYHNNCDGTFTDVSDKSGISALVGRTMGVAAADFDGDGWDDIYVANDRTENFLFRNKHDGTFEEVANDTGTAFGQNGESTSSMGPVFADFEGRGVLDLWVTDGHYNRLLRNQGKTGFEDMGASNGVSQTNAQYVSWGTGVYDFDNDGFLDILIFHGGLIHLIPQEHTLFRGVGGGKFLDVSREAGPVLSVRTTARGACFADYENNGKVGAFLVNLGAKGTLVRDISENTGHWVELKLVGSMRKGDQPNVGATGSAKTNRDGMGARVEIFAGAKRWTAERVASSGYLSQDDGRMHFGLGAADAIDKILIHWPSGREQTLGKQPVDRVITIEEPK
jgi:enediyne biosynthesis protein E4